MFGSQVVVSKDARTTAVNLSGGSYHFVSVAAVYPDGESANGIGIQDVWFNEGSGVNYGSPILLATLLCVTGTMAILVVIWKLRRRG
jgi:hypothetical protein